MAFLFQLIMITVVDNSQKVFLIERMGIIKKSYFCNLESIPRVLQDLEVNDEFTIKSFWNNRFIKVSKKTLNEMFKNNNILYAI